MPVNLAGQLTNNIGTNALGQFSISLIDIFILALSILFMTIVLIKRNIPLFGGFWYHQKPRPLSNHEGQRFLFLKKNDIFIGYKPTHDRDFWKKYFILYEEILSFLRREMQVEEKLANWMLAISGGALILMTSNYNKLQVTEYEIIYKNILLYSLPDKILYIFILFTLLVSACFHFSSKLGLYHLQGDLETALAYIPLSEGISDLNSARTSISNLKRDLNSMTEADIPIEYSALISRFESVESNLDINRANNWRRFQIGNAFFIVSLFSLVTYYIFYIIYN